MMTTLAADTSPHIEQMQIERLRQLPPWRKLVLVGDLKSWVDDGPDPRLQKPLYHPDDDGRLVPRRSGTPAPATAPADRLGQGQAEAGALSARLQRSKR